MDERRRMAFGIVLLLGVLGGIVWELIMRVEDIFNLRLPVFLRLLDGFVVVGLIFFTLLLFLLLFKLIRNMYRKN
jgi:hypothetical protein